ncbi:MAG: energy transducer TonB [Pyrinomonadaceae bacterium]
MKAKIGFVFVMWLTGVITVLSQDWQRYQPTADSISVEVPFAMTSRGGADEKSWRKYFGHDEKTWLYVFSDTTRDAYRIGTIIRFADSQGQKVKIGKSLGQPIHFKDEFGYWHSILSINTGSRIYLVQAVSSTEHSEIGERFLSSFKILQKADSTAAVPMPEIPPSDQVTTLPTVRGQGSGRGSGNGNGSGVGSGSTPLIPMKIISKAVPAYTELAGIYEITGTVITRITFLESGQVGDISIVRGLPFGLNEKAIAAAQRITFQPAVLSGTPVPVVKLVEYSFSIY